MLKQDLMRHLLSEFTPGSLSCQTLTVDLMRACWLLSLTFFCKEQMERNWKLLYVMLSSVWSIRLCDQSHASKCIFYKWIQAMNVLPRIIRSCWFSQVQNVVWLTHKNRINNHWVSAWHSYFDRWVSKLMRFFFFQLIMTGFSNDRVFSHHDAII